MDGIIKEYIATKKNGVRPNTLKRYENYFNRMREYFEEYFPLPANNIKLIKDTYVKEFINFMKEKDEEEDRTIWAKKTVNGFIVTAKQLLNYAVVQGYIETNPLTDIKEYKIAEKGKLEFFSDSELEMILANMDPYWVNPL